jgi:hypothetical protein
VDTSTQGVTKIQFLAKYFGTPRVRELDSTLTMTSNGARIQLSECESHQTLAAE